MSLVPQRASPRWKEWIPLISQQQRLRNLIQVLAYNVSWRSGCYIYFTLHLTTMSPPFYTSERLQHQNPKWDEMDLCSLSPTINTSATGVVVRLWRHEEGQSQDQVVLVWGLYLSGLIYLGPKLNLSASNFNDNTIVLHLQGGYFTALASLKELPPAALVRNVSVLMPASDARPSYTVARLLSLRAIQQLIKARTLQANNLREKVHAGGVSGGEGSASRENSVTLRKLLSRGKPKPQQRREMLAARCQAEVLRFRVALLQREKQRKLAQVQTLQKQRDAAAVEIVDRSCELTEKYQNLHKEVEQLKENRKQFLDMRENFLSKSGQMNIRRRQLMSQLSLIYPVSQQSDGKYTICGIHLPNSEDLASSDDVTVSVALGFVAHLVQMISIFMQVPLRYPIIHFGSRSKIIDFIADKIPEKEREFPLFARGKDKLQFHYGVYLLNKDISQLRWLVGFPTTDLRTTLQNVYHLLHINHFAGLSTHHHSMSGSSLDVNCSSTNVSPVGSLASNVIVGHSVTTNQLRMRHKTSKSMGSGELLFPASKGNVNTMGLPLPQMPVPDSMANSANLSYSLDKGLDEYEEIKNNTSSSAWPSSSGTALVAGTCSLAHVGSEPNLTSHSNHSHHPISLQREELVKEPNAQTQFLQQWQAGGGVAPNCSDDDEGFSVGFNCEDVSHKSEFSIVTERIAKLVDSSKHLDFNEGRESLSGIAQIVDEAASSSPKSENNLPSQDCVFVSSEKCVQNSLVQARHDSVASTEEAVEDPVFKLTVNFSSENRNTFLGKEANISDEAVDVATDALADILHNDDTEPKIDSCDTVSNIPHEGQRFLNRRQASDENGMECIGVEESVMVDNLFASVTSRTEALASRTTSFNLMSSRHSSTS